jgi:hypothetical protein
LNLGGWAETHSPISKGAIMPYKYPQVDSHADAVKKSGTVTAPGLYGKSPTPVKQDANYKVRPNSDKK